MILNKAQKTKGAEEKKKKETRTGGNLGAITTYGPYSHRLWSDFAATDLQHEQASRLASVAGTRV
jgi:hypothetical protein